MINWSFAISPSDNGGVSCNQVNTCDVNADCIYDPATGAHVCRCRSGYQGDGYVCQLFGKLTTSRLCTNHFKLDTLLPISKRTTANSSHTNLTFTRYVILGDCSRDPSICDVNALCTRRGYDFVCECNPGYRGDGTRCIRKHHSTVICIGISVHELITIIYIGEKN